MNESEKSGSSKGSYVLDAYAVMAYIRDEPGGLRVKELIRAAGQGKIHLYLSIINYGEVLYSVERRWGKVELRRVISTLDSLPIEIMPVDRPLVVAAAHVKARYPLSYADAFAVALAQRLGAAIITGDPEFRAVEGLVRIEWLPTKTL